MFEYDFFLSFAKPDEEAAKKLKQKAERKRLKVYLAPSELEPGDLWTTEVRNALRRSREIAVLATKKSIDREWVISEWSCGWLLGRKITAILKDVKLEKLPTRLKEPQVAYYDKLDEFFDAVIKRREEDPFGDLSMSAYQHFGIQKGIQETLFAPEIGTSPFVFPKLLPLAKKRILVAGQNLYSLIVANQQANEDFLFHHLKDNDQLNVQFMVCDPEHPLESDPKGLNEAALKIWKWVTAEDYEKDLWLSIAFLKKWIARAKQEKLVANADQKSLRLEARVVHFVPVSTTFLDPSEEEGEKPVTGKAFLTPNIWEREAKFRSCFFVYQPLHLSAFNKCWGPFKTTYSRGRNVAEVILPPAVKREADRLYKTVSNDVSMDDNEA